MKVQVLLSCMNEVDTSIVGRSNIQSDVVVVNQCGTDSTREFTFKNNKGEECRCKFINTTQRGLSNSRNLALKNAWNDICILCDDDEVFKDDYPEKIIMSYNGNPGYQLLFFEIGNRANGKTGYRKRIEINRRKSLAICSVQISFLRKAVIDSNIVFNPKFGAGVTQAGGEEHIFLYDCFKHGLKGLNVPIEISSLNENSSSTWWRGISREYLIDEGQVLRQLFGLFGGLAASTLFIIKKRDMIRTKLDLVAAYKAILRGVFRKD